MKDLKDMDGKEKQDIAQVIVDAAKEWDDFSGWLRNNFTFIVSKADKVEAHYQPERDPAIAPPPPGHSKQFGSKIPSREEVKEKYRRRFEEDHARWKKSGDSPKIQLSDEDTNPEILQAEVEWLRDNNHFLKQTNAGLRNLSDVQQDLLDNQELFVKNLIQLQKE